MAGAGSARDAAGTRGGAGEQPGDGLARAAPAWNFPLGCRPPPATTAKRGSSPRPRPAGPGTRGGGGAGRRMFFPRSAAEAGGGAGRLAGLKRVGEG